MLAGSLASKTKISMPCASAGAGCFPPPPTLSAALSAACWRRAATPDTLLTRELPDGSLQIVDGHLEMRVLHQMVPGAAAVGAEGIQLDAAIEHGAVGVGVGQDQGIVVHIGGQGRGQDGARGGGSAVP